MAKSNTRLRRATIIAAHEQTYRNFITSGEGALSAIVVIILILLAYFPRR